MSTVGFRWLARGSIGVALLWAAFGKLITGATGDTIYHGLVGRGLVLHYLFCVSEGLLGLWVLSGRNLRWSAAAAVLVLSVFAGTVTLELTREHPKPCGCGFVAPRYDPERIRRSLELDLGLNVALLGLGSALFMAGAGQELPLRVQT